MSTISLLQISWTDIQYSQEELDRVAHTFPVHLRVLVACALTLVMFSLVFLFIIFTSRITKTKREWKRSQLHGKYSPVFNELLFGETDLSEPSEIISRFDTVDLKSSYSRKILADALIHMHANLSGDITRRVESLFRILGFHNDQLALLADKKWHLIARGMRNLALMNIHEACDRVTPFLNHRNEIVRYEARIVLMKLSKGDHLAFLDQEKSWLSDWDQANIYAMLVRIPDVVIPDFSRWLASNNPSVVDFSIYMIGRFNQLHNIPALLEMLPTCDERKKILIIRAIRQSNAKSAEVALMSMYAGAVPGVQEEILLTLKEIATEESAPFMIGLLQRPSDSISTYITAAQCLSTLGAGGQSVLSRLLDSGNARVDMAIRHALDKRI